MPIVSYSWPTNDFFKALKDGNSSEGSLHYKGKAALSSPFPQQFWLRDTRLDMTNICMSGKYAQCNNSGTIKNGPRKWGSSVNIVTRPRTGRPKFNSQRGQ